MIKGHLAEAYNPKYVEVRMIKLAPGVTMIKLRGEDRLIIEIMANEEAREGQEPSGVSPRINKREGSARAPEELESLEEEMKEELKLAWNCAHELETELE